MSSSVRLDWRSDAGSRRSGQARSDRFAFGFCSVGFLLTMAAFYPGFAPPDALDQYQQGLSGHYSDWHPPIMALLWSNLDRVWSGPQPMLLIQAGLYWCATALLLDSVPGSSPRLVRWAIAAACISPAILCSLGVIEKDTQLTVSWVLAAVICYRQRTAGFEPSWAAKLGLLVMVTYGALLRQNSGLVAGPLVLYILIARPVLGRLWTTLVLYGCVAAVFVVMAASLNIALDADRTHVLRGLLNFDLAGISLRSGENLFPFAVDPAEMKRLDTCYDGGTWHNNLVWGDCAFIWQRGLATPLSDGSYIHAWLSAIARHPLAYALHRLTYFARFSGLVTLQPTHGFWTDGTPTNDLGFATYRHPLFYALKYYVYAGLATPFLRVGFWLAASGTLALWCMRRPVSDVVCRRFAMLAGLLSFAYILTYLPFGLAPDFRYVHIAVVLTTFGYAAVAATVFGGAGGAGVQSTERDILADLPVERQVRSGLGANAL